MLTTLDSDLEVLDIAPLMISSSVEEESVDTIARLLMFELWRPFLCRVTTRLTVSSFVPGFTAGDDINFESIVLQNKNKIILQDLLK